MPVGCVCVCVHVNCMRHVQPASMCMYTCVHTYTGIFTYVLCAHLYTRVPDGVGVCVFSHSAALSFGLVQWEASRL